MSSMNNVLSNIYTLIFIAFGVCVAAVAILAAVEQYNKRRIRHMSFVQLHQRQLKRNWKRDIKC